MLFVYVYHKCSTCLKALDFLEQTKIPFEIKEITKTTPSIEELQRMLKYQGGSLKKLFNTSGHLYKELNLSEKLNEMSQEQALALLNINGMLIKRPFLIGQDFGFVGFKEREWQKLLP